MQNIEKWIGIGDAIHLFRDASIDSSMNNALLQPNVSWHGKHVEAHVLHIYTTYVAPNYKASFAKRGPHELINKEQSQLSLATFLLLVL